MKKDYPTQATNTKQNMNNCLSSFSNTKTLAKNNKEGQNESLMLMTQKPPLKTHISEERLSDASDEY